MQQKQQIIDAFESGMECRNIPQQFGFTGRSVARVLAEAGVNTKRRNRYQLNEGYFDKIDSQVKAYLLGLMAADGCVTDTNYVAFESIDSVLTELLKSELEYSGEVRLVKPQNYAVHHRINFSSVQLAHALRTQGVEVGRTASGAYYFPPSDYLSAYILGYFDGDGCAYVNEGRSGGSVSIVGSCAFSTELRHLLKMGSVDKHYKGNVFYWRIHGRTQIQAFYNFVYQHPGLGLVRKKDKIEAILRSYKRNANH